MNEVIKWASRAGAVILAWLCQALGGWDAALGMMFLMMGLDLVSGLVLCLRLASARTRSGGFDSGVFFQGLTRKLLMVLLVILGTGLDTLLGTSVCRLSIIGFYAANEAFSVVENAALAGVPFPRGLLKLLERYRARMDGIGEEQGGEEDVKIR